MNGKEAVFWIASVCGELRKSQSKTLGDLVSMALRIGRASLSELGRLPAEGDCGKLDGLPVQRGTQRP